MLATGDGETAMKWTAGLLIFCIGAAMGMASPQALASCGVIQKSATAKSAKQATNRAESRVKSEIKTLRAAHGKKLQLDQKQVACVGRGVAVDANGNQIVGQPSCTVTQPFCINP
jgi:uncharacterized protein YggE